MIKKIANQCATFDGKGKLTVDDLYSVIKVQVPLFIAIYFCLYKRGRVLHKHSKIVKWQPFILSIFSVK